MTVVFHGRVIELPGGRSVKLEADISQTLEVGNVVVVRLRVEPGSIMNENVVALDRDDGKLLWKIPVRQHVYRDSPYTAISKEGSYAWVHNWDGTDLKIDPKTGEILEERFTK